MPVVHLLGLEVVMHHIWTGAPMIPAVELCGMVIGSRICGSVYPLER